MTLTLKNIRIILLANYMKNHPNEISNHERIWTPESLKPGDDPFMTTKLVRASPHSDRSFCHLNRTPGLNISSSMKYT